MLSVPRLESVVAKIPYIVEDITVETTELRQMLPILAHLGSYSSLKSHTLVEFFVVEDHLIDGVLFLLDVDQALTTQLKSVKCLLCRARGTAASRLSENVPSYLVQNY